MKIDLPEGFTPVKDKEVKISAVITNAANAFNYKLPISLEKGTKEIEFNNPPVIHPHESFPCDFKVKAGWSAHPFRPRPDTYKLRVAAEYDKDSKTCFASETIDLSLFPSFGSMLTGTLAGSLLGTIVKNADTIPKIQPPALASQGDFVAQVMSIFAIPLIFGLIAGLILMRKKDVQPFLTIEDFWGGIVVGFAVGYGGSSILTRLLPTELGGSGSNQTSGT
jgi:hypothetical protein